MYPTNTLRDLGAPIPPTPIQNCFLHVRACYIRERIQLQRSVNSYIYIFQVYLPSSNHPISEYRSYVDKLNDIIHVYVEKGIVIVMGDINAHLNSQHYSKPANNRTKYIETLLSTHNFVSINTLDLCEGAKSSFVTYDGRHESLIDHILVSADLLDTVTHSEIVEDSALNVSSHRPVLCSIHLPTCSKSRVTSEPRLKWETASAASLTQYHDAIQTDSLLNDMLEIEISTPDSIDAMYTNTVERLTIAADKFIPKSKYKHHLKPYWTPVLSNLNKSMADIRKKWIELGKPRGSDYSVYNEYKRAKAQFRKAHRRAVNNYLIKLNRDIDHSAEVDCKLFWKLINARKASVVPAGNQMSFNGIMIRDAEEITNGWGNYFKNLYTPENHERFDSQFYDNVMSNIAILNRDLFQNNNVNDNIATVDDKLIDALIRKGKRGKAPGVDKISHEHFVFGGNVLRKNRI